MNPLGKINYVEFHTMDLAATKLFFGSAFGWEFTDFGEEYTAFYGQGLDGGFFKSDTVLCAAKGAPLIVFYSPLLEESLSKVEKAEGTITRAIFPFPGGRRFHFTEPGGNEFAVWSDIGDPALDEAMS